MGVDLVGGLGGGGAGLSTGEATRKVRVRGCGLRGVAVGVVTTDILSECGFYTRAFAKAQQEHPDFRVYSLA